MKLRTQIICCALGALIAGTVASSAAVILFGGIISRDWETLKLEPAVKEAQVQALLDRPAGKLIAQLSADAKSYSETMVALTTKLAGLLSKQAVSAFVGGIACFLLFCYVGFTLWKRGEAT